MSKQRIEKMHSNPTSNEKSCLKWALGCGGFVVTLIIGLAVVGYMVVKTFSGGVSNLRELSEIHDVEVSIINQTEFTPPNDGLLSLEQVDQLVYIFSEMKQALGPDYAAKLDTLYALQGRLEKADRMKRLRNFYDLDPKIVATMKLVKDAEVRALNKTGISFSQYQWMCYAVATSLEVEMKRVGLESVLNQEENSSSNWTNQWDDYVINPSNADLLGANATLLRQLLVLKNLGI